MYPDMGNTSHRVTRCTEVTSSGLDRGEAKHVVSKRDTAIGLATWRKYPGTVSAISGEREDVLQVVEAVQDRRRGGADESIATTASVADTHGSSG